MRRLTGIMSLLLAAVVLGMGAATECLAQNWNFEAGDLRSWTATGTAFNQQPTFGDNVSARLPGVPTRHEGNYWIGTFESRSNAAAPAGGIQGDAPTGTLTSSEFTIAGPHLSFLIGGGNDFNRLRVELLVKIGVGESVPPAIVGLLGIGERVVLSDGEYFVGAHSTGRNSESMRREIWDIRVYMNRRARIRIKDESSRPWGHLNVDDIRLDSPIAGTQGDVWVTGMEITQAIQTFPDNAIPLILDKPTIVRVYVAAREDSRGRWSDVSANLIVRRRPGGPQIGPTLRPVTSNAAGTIAVSPGGSERGSLSDSLNFVLTPEQTEQAEIEVEVRTFSVSRRPEFDTDNNLLRSSFHFAASRDMSFYCLSYRYSTPPDTTAPVFWEFEPHRAWAQNALPLANLWADPFPGYPIGDIAHRSVQNDDGSFRDDGYVDARAWAQQMIDRLQPAGGAWVVLMQPEFDAGYHGAHYVDGVGNHVINMQRNTFDPGPTLAHELGHGWGQGHTWENTAFPHADGGLGNQVGIRFFRDTLEILKSPTHHDIMSYRHPQWFSPYTYTEILRQMSDGRLVVPVPVRDARLQLMPPLPRTVGFQPQFVKAAFNRSLAGKQNKGSENDHAYLYVSGWITQGTATFLPFEKISFSKQLSVRPAGSSYRVILQDASGKLLGEYGFDKPVVADDDKSRFLFSMYVAFDSDVSRIALVSKEGSVLAERKVTPNSPRFMKVGCNCDGPLTGKRKIYWEGSDADGDALTYSVWYSANRGETWIPQQIGLTQNSFEVDFGMLPGSEQAMIRVMASDGVNTTEVRLPQLLHVANKKPSVAIAPVAPLPTNRLSSTTQAAAPPGNTVFVSETHPLLLTGSSFDYEDGRITDSRAFQWTSNRDGRLGTGSWIVLTKLSPGKHRITLSVNDSAQLSGSAFLELDVRGKQPLEGAAPSLRR